MSDFCHPVPTVHEACRKCGFAFTSLRKCGKPRGNAFFIDSDKLTKEHMIGENRSNEQFVRKRSAYELLVDVSPVRQERILECIHHRFQTGRNPSTRRKAPRYSLINGPATMPEITTADVKERNT